MAAAPETAASLPERTRSRRAWLATAAIALAFAATRVAILDVPSDRAYDEGVYLLSARSVASGHALFTEVFSSQPPVFLESLALALRVAGDRMETGRLLILAFSIASLAAIADVARRAFGTIAAPAAAAALALSMTFGDLGHVVQAESPALAMALLSLSACLESRRRGWSAPWLAFSGALLAVGCLFKLMAIPLAAPLGFLLLLAPAGADETLWQLDGAGTALLRRTLFRAATVAAGAAVVVVLALAPYDLASVYSQTVAFHLAKQEVYRATLPSNVQRTALHLIANAAISATAALGALLLLRQRRRLVLGWLAFTLVVMLAAVAQQRPLFWRHFVLLSPPLVLAAAAAVELAARRLPRPWKPAPLLAALALWSTEALLDRGHDSALYPLWPESAYAVGYVRALRTSATWLREHTATDEYVVSDDPLVVYLAGRQAPPALCDTSMARILARSLTLDVATRESAPARVIVLRRGGRLSMLGGYSRWVARHYERQPARATGLPESRGVWLRRPPARPT